MPLTQAGLGSQEVAAPHSPDELHTRYCGVEPLTHSRAPGVQEPPHRSPTHANLQLLGWPHAPCALQVFTCVVDAHWVAFGVQVAQAPFTQVSAQVLCSHLPFELQVSRTPAVCPQRLVPGRQSPPHAFETQALGHVEFAPNSPLSPHVWSSVFDAHCFAPGLQ